MSMLLQRVIDKHTSLLLPVLVVTKSFIVLASEQFDLIFEDRFVQQTRLAAAPTIIR
jgi:hypothetical protein